MDLPRHIWITLQRGDCDPGFHHAENAVMVLSPSPGSRGHGRNRQKVTTARMIRPLFLCSILALAACQGGPTPEAPARANLAGELLRRSQPGSPPAPPGTCWASDVIPAVIETVTEQFTARPAILAPDGSVQTPAIYRTVTQQKIVKDRETVWFRTPCPEVMTADFIATLQRALKARGYYLLSLTGQLDPPTPS